MQTVILNSIQRDLKVDRASAEVILAAQRKAANNYPAIKRLLGESYGGAWFDPEINQMVVATTDTKDFPWIRLVDSVPILVEYSAEDLGILSRMLWEQTQAGLSAYVISSIRLDYRKNALEVEVNSELWNDAWRQDIQATFESWPVFWSEAQTEPVLFGTLTGGQRINNPDHPKGLEECSVGFGVAGGFLTAAHCGWHPHRAQNFNNVPVGDFIAASFPPDITYLDDPHVGLKIYVPAENFDHAFVASADGWSSSATIGNGSQTLQVTGSAEQLVGVTVCRFGSKTGGPHCGEIISKNHSFSIMRDWFSNLYPGDQAVPIPITGLIEARVCAEAKDSGGPLVFMGSDGSVQAQGLLSGGNGSIAKCTDPENPERRTWYSPVNDALEALNVELLTGGGASQPLPPGSGICSSGKGEANLTGCGFDPPGVIESQLTEIQCSVEPEENRGRRERRFFCNSPLDLAENAGLKWSGGLQSQSAGNGYFGFCQVGDAIEVKASLIRNGKTYSNSVRVDC